MNNKKCEVRGKYLNCYDPSPFALSNCYSTSELIAELERRNPDCRNCSWPTCDLCLGCFWKDFGWRDIFKTKEKNV